MTAPLREALAEPFTVRCADCKHVWAPFFLPLPLGFSAELMMKKATCPKCGADSSHHHVLGDPPTKQEIMDGLR